VESPYSGDKIYIKATGTWVKEDDAEYFVEQKYPVYCNATKRVEHRKMVFYASPTIDQERLRPKED